MQLTNTSREVTRRLHEPRLTLFRRKKGLGRVLSDTLLTKLASHNVIRIHKFWEMTGRFRFPTIQNHWSNFMKNHFFRQKVFRSPQKSQAWKNLKILTINWGSPTPETSDLSLTLSPCQGKTNLFYSIWPSLQSRAPKIWLDESRIVKSPDWLNSQPRKTWSDDSGRVKSPDWLDSQPRKTWLDQSGRVKSPDWLTSQPPKTWLDESGRVKSPDWLNSQPRKAWLADFYMC